MKFKPFPEINTERLFLRKIEESDAEVILFLRSDKMINKFIERPEHRKTKNISDAIKFIKETKTGIDNNTFISWGITIKTESKIIGTICLWNFSQDNKTAEVGYDLHPEFQGKGIMSEALKGIIDFGFTILKINRIEAFTHNKNKDSKKLLIKNGFSLLERRKDKDNPSNIVFEIKKSVVKKNYNVL